MKSVVLVHGLWMPGLAMSPLAARLSRAGYHCHLFDYAGRDRPLATNAERLVQLGRRIGPAHFVGHSLGGLVVMEALNSDLTVGVGRVALLGRLARYGFGRWMLGESEALWREGRAARWRRPEPLGVLAGNFPFGLGRSFGRLPGPNDGVVCVDETAIEGAAAFTLLPVSHSGMLLSARVARALQQFLETGRFAPYAN
jgi:pimeloyl-ACP methyl ester carboxylesterase